MPSTCQIIADQIGKPALFMMGAQNIIGGNNYLSFKIRGSKICTHIRVTLSHDDTYSVTFYKIQGTTIKRKEEINGVYIDKLREVIESNTGLYLSLGTMGQG